MNDEKMKEALTTLPDSLEAMYADVLSNKIPKDYVKEARLMLIWLSYSLRPLTLQELACVASIPEPRDVLDICTSSLVSLRRNRRRTSSLVSLRRNRRRSPKLKDKDDYEAKQSIVQLDHFSVQEYLTSEHLLASMETTFFYVTPLVAHLTIAEISVSHFLKTNKVDLATGKGIEATLAEEFDGEVWRPGEDHLLDYSVGWFRHIQEANTIEKNAPDSKNPKLRAYLAVTESQPEFLRAQIHKVFCEVFSQSMQNWLYLVEKNWRFDRYRFPLFFKLHPRPTSALFTASWCDFPDNVERLLSSGAAVDGDTSSNLAKITKPIQAAAIAGSLESLRLLLEKNANLTKAEFGKIVSKNYSHGAAILSSILEARPHLAITEGIVRRSWRNSVSSEMLKYILDKPDSLTETLLLELIKGCVHLGEEDDLVHRIFSRGEIIGCDERLILQAFCRDSSCERNIKLVIDRYKPPPSKSQEIMMWVIHNRRIGASILPVILEYYRTVGVETEFSQDMLLQAARSGYHARELFWTILDYAKRIVISEKVIRSLARDKLNGVIILNLHMDHADCRVITYPLAIYKHFHRCPRRISDEMAKSAARWEPSAIEYLQAHARSNVTFTKTPAEAESLGSESEIFDSDVSDSDVSDSETCDSDTESLDSDHESSPR